MLSTLAYQKTKAYYNGWWWTSCTILIVISQSQPPSMDTKNAKRKKIVGASSSWTPEWLSGYWSWWQKEQSRAEEDIIEKEFSAFNVSRGHSLNALQQHHWLGIFSPMEQRIIEDDEGKNHMTGVAKLVVKLADSYVLREFDVNLRRWKMKNKRGNHTFVYNLIRWKQVVEGEGWGLKQSDKIRLWSFHSVCKLYFALTTLPPLFPSPSSDSRETKPEEIGYASVI